MNKDNKNTELNDADKKLHISDVSISSSFDNKKWFWKMDYCKKKQIPPAQSWAWDEAETTHNEQN
jgi:hypothetical protein